MTPPLPIPRHRTARKETMVFDGAPARGGVRHLLDLRDLTADQIRELFRTTQQLKRTRTDRKDLNGKTLGLLFQKPSVRTRVSFEVGMAELGGRSLYIGPVELEQGKRESSRDLAQVLSRYLHGIVARTFSHQEVVELAQHARIPVINGLSDLAHPCQALSDLFTIEERFGKLKGTRIAYVGDGNNVCHSLIQACALMGAELALACPARYEPDREILSWGHAAARRSGGQLQLIRSPQKAVRKAQVVYTDVWTSMGQEKEERERQRAFQGFQVNRNLLGKAAASAVFMHCLPAHRGEEVTYDVMDSRRSIVYDQAENRLHVQKAILLLLLKERKR